jgi:hypothetical protein
MIEVGQLYSERLWSNTYLAGEYPNYPNGNTDQVHFQEMGAIQLAKYVVEGIQKLNTHADMKKLIPFLKPQYTVTVKANIAGVGLITRTETYPAGLNIHLKAIPNSGHTFLNWKNATGTQLTTNPIYQFTMGSANTSYTAYFDSEGTADCAGVINGKASLDQCGICTGGTTGKAACVVDCKGVKNGTAKLDNCGICTGGTTQNKTCTASIEAETACVLEGIIDNNNAGFTGTGFANSDNVVGATIAFVINSPSLQTATVSFKYANGGTTNRDGEIIVNGKLVSTLSLAPTGAWTTWLTVSVNLNLIQGLNNLSVKAKTADGLANIDVVHVSSGVTSGNCVVTGLEESLEFRTSIYPNPTKGKVYFTTETEWTLLNQFGELLSQGTSKEVNLENQIPGVYILKVEGEVVKIVKE